VIIRRGRYRWFASKAAKLSAAGRPSFDDVLDAIEAAPERLLNIVEHHNQAAYPGQLVMHVRLPDGRVCAVAFDPGPGNGGLLRTVYPNSKLRRFYDDARSPPPD
jgi:anti-sigma regulatory factor (Ser/Thr protein kinase)